MIVAIAAFLVAAAPSLSAGNWKTVQMKDGAECEGLVFESAEDAEEAALKMGCSGYHEHSMEDGTVLYMPCAIGDKA